MHHTTFPRGLYMKHKQLIIEIGANIYKNKPESITKYQFIFGFLTNPRISHTV
jgi:hypothetical protein